MRKLLLLLVLSMFASLLLFKQAKAGWCVGCDQMGTATYASCIGQGFDDATCHQQKMAVQCNCEMTVCAFSGTDISLECTNGNN